MADSYPVRATVRIIYKAFTALKGIVMAGATAVAVGATNVLRRLSAGMDGATVVEVGETNIIRRFAAAIAGATVVSNLGTNVTRRLSAEIDGATVVEAGSPRVLRRAGAEFNGATVVAGSIRATGAIEVLATGEEVIETDGDQTLLVR